MICLIDISAYGMHGAWAVKHSQEVATDDERGKKDLKEASSMELQRYML